MNETRIAPSDAVMRAELHQLIASGKAQKIRKDAGLSLAELARECSVDPSTMWRWEHGERRPSSKRGTRYHQLLLRLAALTQQGGAS